MSIYNVLNNGYVSKLGVYSTLMKNHTISTRRFESVICSNTAAISIS